MAVPFITPTNQRSFSALIDAAILATGKPGSLTSAVQYANLSIRECQSLGLFAGDLIEDIIYPDQDAYIWYKPAFFRRARTFKYVNSCEFPKLLLPGRIQRGEFYYYYAADNYFVFKGVDDGEQIKSAIYYWSKPLGYFNQLGVNSSMFPGGPYATRLAYYDSDAEIWMYLNTAGDGYVTTTGDTTVDEARQRQALNWLSRDWYDLILSGTKAKIFGSSGDSRGPIEYSAYKQTQAMLKTTSGYESEGF